MWRKFLARNKNERASFDIGDHSAPKYSPRRFLCGGTRMNIIYCPNWPNWSIFGLNGPLWQGVRMRRVIVILGIIQFRNSSSNVGINRDEPWIA